MNTALEGISMICMNGYHLYPNFAKWIFCILIGFVLTAPAFISLTEQMSSPNNTKFLASWLVTFDGLCVWLLECLYTIFSLGFH